MAYPEIAHIFPYCLLNKPAKSEKTMASDQIPKFWDLLEYFWEEDRINKWRSTVFPDPENPNTGVESCFNLLSLCPNAHNFWSRGLFALKPLELSSDRKKLEIKIFWQPEVKAEADERVSLLTEPASSRGLTSSGDCELSVRKSAVIHSGQTFAITTDDPDSRPLPSIQLLDMQWVLQRIVAMCGAAEWSWIDGDDDTDDYYDYSYVGLTSSHILKAAEEYPNICEWVPEPIPLVLGKA
jgi:hypothetical protein